jgi:hypothetical protein
LHDAAKRFLRISLLSKLEFSLYHCFSVQGETLGTLSEGHGQLAQHAKVGQHLIDFGVLGQLAVAFTEGS